MQFVFRCPADIFNSVVHPSLCIRYAILLALDAMRATPARDRSQLLYSADSVVATPDVFADAAVHCSDGWRDGVCVRLLPSSQRHI